MSTSSFLSTSGISPISGTFIQPWLYMSYTDEDWDREMALYKEMGIEYIVMGDCAAKSEKDPWTAIYPSKIPDVVADGDDAILPLLKYAKKYGLKVYLGMGNPHEWWKLDLSREKDGKKLMEMARYAVLFAQELYDIYKKEYPDTFYGFYSVYEIWNHHAWNSASSRSAYADNLSRAFNLIIDKINSLDANMPLLFSPFATPAARYATVENTQAFYTEFFKKTNFRKIDAIAPMDNIGGGGTKIDGLEPWTQAYYGAVKATNFKLQYWQNCENFVQPPADKLAGKDGISYWGSAPVSRLIRQMEIASKYAAKIFCFSYSHYYSPQNNIPQYQQVLKEYLLNGTIPSAPYAPQQLQPTPLVEKDKKGIVLQWSGEKSCCGISRLDIQKNGKPFDFRVPCRMDGCRERTPQIEHSFTDKDFTPGREDTLYELTITDCWGNVSMPAKFLIKKDAPYAAVSAQIL